MILGYYRALPTPKSYAWVSTRYADRWVDHVARSVFDYGYDGAGNWAFNTAYAAVRTGDAFVTRLTNLREAERFIAAGIPLAASIRFSRGQLSGAPIGATSGHLVVISGFTRDGDVVVNDPAARTDASVRRTYDRGQFERAWLRGLQRHRLRRPRRRPPPPSAGHQPQLVSRSVYPDGRVNLTLAGITLPASRQFPRAPGETDWPSGALRAVARRRRRASGR